MALEELAALGPDTPIARSLAVLLAAIESRLPGSDGPDLQHFVEATRRMTQIVESAMVQTPEPSMDFWWFETHKLIDLVRSGFLANPANGHIGELQIELSKAPSEIWGDVDLLTAGLGSLLDWAVQSAPQAESISLRADAVRAPGGHAANETAVIFSVSSSGEVSGESEVALDAAENASPALDLAIAEDAAHALGGELVIPIDSAQRAVGQIRLPQPAPQPATQPPAAR